MVIKYNSKSSTSSGMVGGLKCNSKSSGGGVGGEGGSDGDPCGGDKEAKGEGG